MKSSAGLSDDGASAAAPALPLLTPGDNMPSVSATAFYPPSAWTSSDDEARYNWFSSRYKVYGEQLITRINCYLNSGHPEQTDRVYHTAAKITGMLLELGSERIQEMLGATLTLRAWIDECLRLLGETPPSQPFNTDVVDDYAPWKTESDKSVYSVYENIRSGYKWNVTPPADFKEIRRLVMEERPADFDHAMHVQYIFTHAMGASIEESRAEKDDMLKLLSEISEKTN